MALATYELWPTYKSGHGWRYTSLVPQKYSTQEDICPAKGPSIMRNLQTVAYLYYTPSEYSIYFFR